MSTGKAEEIMLKPEAISCLNDPLLIAPETVMVTDSGAVAGRANQTPAPWGMLSVVMLPMAPTFTHAGPSVNLLGFVALYAR